MGEAGRAAPGPGVAGLLNPVPAQRARLLLAQGDVAAAARWVEERGLGPDDEPGYPREPEYLVLARVLLAQDRPGPALALLGRLHAAATAQGRTGSVIEIQALQALALAAAARRTPQWTPWPGRSPWPARRAMSGCSPTRARRWRALLARLVAAQKADHGRRPRRPARLPGRGAASVRRQGRRAGRNGETPARRCRAWSSS